MRSAIFIVSASGIVLSLAACKPSVIHALDRPHYLSYLEHRGVYLYVYKDDDGKNVGVVVGRLRDGRIYFNYTQSYQTHTFICADDDCSVLIVGDEKIDDTGKYVGDASDDAKIHPSQGTMLDNIQIDLSSNKLEVSSENNSESSSPPNLPTPRSSMPEPRVYLPPPPPPPPYK